MKKRKVKVIFIFLVVLIVSVCIKSRIVEKILYPIKYSNYVEEYSEYYNLDKYLVYSVIKTESKFNPNARSNKDAKGLMQITDKTANWAAKSIGLDNVSIYDPETNIRMGTWYLNRLSMEFKNDLNLMITAYNGGSGNVRKWLNSSKYSDDGESLEKIPFRETSNYTKKVIENYKKYLEIYEGS